MKKRILSMALALVLALSLCVPALAAEEEPAAEPSGDAAPTQRLKEVHLQRYNWLSEKDDEETLTFSYENGGTLPSSINVDWPVENVYAVTYDDEGRVLTGQEVVYTYDEDGRIAEKNCADGGEVYTYRYDEDGRLSGFSYTVDGVLDSEYEYKYRSTTLANIMYTPYSDGQLGETFISGSFTLDENGRVIQGNIPGEIPYGCYMCLYSPQLRIGYYDPDYVEMNSIDPSDCYLLLDVLDAAGTSIMYFDIYSGWVPPIDMTYDDAGYLTHMESSNGYTADFTYEPVA